MKTITIAELKSLREGRIASPINPKLPATVQQKYIQAAARNEELLKELDTIIHRQELGLPSSMGDSQVIWKSSLLLVKDDPYNYQIEFNGSMVKLG